jgi:endonuclease/exonuclease/phosphatase family metal-dependent hydrolase
MSMGILRVVQLNAGSLLEPGWPTRRNEIVAWLDRLQPDVVWFREIWQDESNPNTAGWIAAQMPDIGWHWCFDGRSFGERLWPDPGLLFGSAVLSRWPIEMSAYYPLPVVDDEDPFVASVPWELLHVRTAGLDVFSCHLAAAPRHGYHRRYQVLAIDDLITDARGELDATPNPGQIRDAMPPILCGDFNAEPDSDEIRFLCSLAVLDGRTAFYQDAWRVAGEGPGYTQDWRTNSIAASLNVHRKRIDYVFVGDPFQRRDSAGRVLTAQLAFHEPLTGTLASDHTGLAVDIVWPDRPH